MERLVKRGLGENTAVWKIYQLLYVGPLLGETGDLDLACAPTRIHYCQWRVAGKRRSRYQRGRKRGGRATRPVLDPSTHPMAGV